MPFTFSHPAIVLPLAKSNRGLFSLTALIAGSLAPDFAFFFVLKFGVLVGHSLVGLFLFDLPVGVAICFVFHLTVRHDLLANLPAAIRSRFPKTVEHDWHRYFSKNWLAVVVSVLAGAFSHLFWDAFTHSDGYFVTRINLLHARVAAFSFSMRVYNALQLLSTLVGLLVIGYFIYKLPQTKSKPVQINTWYWIVLLTVTLLGVLLIFGSGLRPFRPEILLLACISSGLTSLVITPAILQLQRRLFATT